MENQSYLVALMDGTRFTTTNVNLKATKTMLDNPKVFAVKLGNKSVQKQMIAFVAKKEAVEADEKNIILTAANEMFYLVADDVDGRIEAVTNEINQKNWVLVDDAVLFNRGSFQYLEEKIEVEE